MQAGVRRIALSLDAPSPEVHDCFRQVPGSWERTMRILMGAESRRSAFSASFARMALSAVGNTVSELAQRRMLQQLVPALLHPGAERAG